MRAVVQRVSQASVTVDGQVIGAIDGPGLLVLVGVTHDDTKPKAAKLAAKLWGLRILRDEKSCEDVNAPLLADGADDLSVDGDARLADPLHNCPHGEPAYRVALALGADRCAPVVVATG